MGVGLATARLQGQPFIDPWVLVGVLVLALLGLVDDVRSLHVSTRLVVQAIVCCTLGAAMSTQSVAGTWTTVLVAIATAIWLLGYTNAFNFMDGVNGISGLNAALAAGWYAYVARISDLSGVAVLGLVVAASAVGFLPWNFPRARVFLGDVGSYALGLSIACIAVILTSDGVNFRLVIPPLILYVADTGITLVRRIVAGRSWREAHREHVYQRLADQWGHTWAAGTTVCLSALMIAPAIAMDGLNDALVLLGFLAVMCFYFALPGLTRQVSGARPS